MGLQNINLLRLCKVLSIDDKEDGDRIKVRLLPEDEGKSLDKIDYCTPLLPLNLHIKPKVGELVAVMLAKFGDGNSERRYIGPIISQKQRLYKEQPIMGVATLRGSYLTPQVSTKMKPKMRGAFPKDEDIAIEGRKNTGVELKNNDALLKAGVKVSNPLFPDEITFNTKNPAYVLLRYDDYKQLTEKNIPYQSTATIVADKINLISPDSKKAPFSTTDPDDLITQEEMKKIIDKAYKLPYGEELVDFLKLLKDAFLTHTHKYATMMPVGSDKVVQLEQYDLNKILSDNVRIN